MMPEYDFSYNNGKHFIIYDYNKEPLMAFVNSEDYQIIIGEFLHDYNIRLESNPYLMGGNIRLVDIAIMPFIRQCANVDLSWFNNQFYHLEKWLTNLISSELFISVMSKYDTWVEDSKGILIEWE